MRGVNIAHIKCLVRNFKDFKLPRGISSVGVDEKPLHQSGFLSYCSESTDLSVCKYSAIFFNIKKPPKITLMMQCSKQISALNMTPFQRATHRPAKRTTQ